MYGQTDWNMENKDGNDDYDNNNTINYYGNVYPFLMGRIPQYVQ
jgi:hypothetical protein